MDEVPFEDRHVPRVEVDWERSSWWVHPLTRAIHPAVRMSALAVGLVAIVLARAGIELGNRLFAPDWQPIVTLNGGRGAFPPPILAWTGDFVQSLLSLRQFRWNELAFVTFLLLWLTLVFSLLGGILARRSLVELGQRTIAAWGDSTRIVFSRWSSFLWWMGMHWVGIAGLLMPIAALGALSRFGAIGATLAGVLLLLCFPLVFAIGRFLISMIVCFPLSVCAIVAEKKADAFEGFSRSNAYFFQRVTLASVGVLTLFLFGLIGEQLVFWTVTLGWSLIRGTYLLAGGVMQPTSNTYVAAGNWLSSSLIAAFWFSFFWTGSAAMYLILRRSVDNTELDELDMLESPLERSLPEIPTTPPVASELEAPAADPSEKAP